MDKGYLTGILLLIQAVEMIAIVVLVIKVIELWREVMV